MARRVAPKGNEYGLVHGFARRGKRPAIYRRWQHMIQRCHNPNDKDYVKYGAKGIQVCQAWRESFAAFYADMGDPPTSKHTLDRLDNARGYEPTNCRWATPQEQADNRRRTTMLTVDGVTKPLTTWAREVGIGPKTLRYRVFNIGMSHKDAVFKPLNKLK